MLKQKIKIILSLVIFLTFPELAFGAPSISGVSGTVSDGQSLTISGVNFGYKSQATPLVWETFDSGSNGQAIGGWNGWMKYAGESGGTLTNTSSYSGSISAFNRITGPDALNPVSDTEFNTSNYFFSPTDEIYYSYVAKIVSTGDDYGVDKWGRVNCAPNTYNGPGDMTVQLGHVSFNTGSGVYEANDDSGKDVWVTTRFANWTRQEMYRKLSTPGIANGMVQFRIGPEMRTWTNIITRESGYFFQQTNIILGLMFANPQNDGDHNMYVDDVYVDNTRARVEICDASTWASRTKCDIQIPNEWSGAEITFNVNIPGFIESSESYLYVVDENGEVNTNGFPVVIGSVDIISPGAPINLNVI